jgi:hypothetical protein
VENEFGELILNPAGIIDSFLLSVGNNTQWIPVVTHTTHKCYDQFANSGQGFDCEGFCGEFLDGETNLIAEFQLFHWTFMT